ncbi:MAG: hypothetical protein K0S65_4876 [Labilithrix sp.]|nr:hypothetical protein [Labilithrix sp.]
MLRRACGRRLRRGAALQRIEGGRRRGRRRLRRGLSRRIAPGWRRAAFGRGRRQNPARAGLGFSRCEGRAEEHDSCDDDQQQYAAARKHGSHRAAARSPSGRIDGDLRCARYWNPAAESENGLYGRQPSAAHSALASSFAEPCRSYGCLRKARCISSHTRGSIVGSGSTSTSSTWASAAVGVGP